VVFGLHNYQLIKIIMDNNDNPITPEEEAMPGVTPATDMSAEEGSPATEEETPAM